ncbi:MAG TPA: type II toxin-antitoxin system VapC family toxin [Gemmataceae bacterium]|nr:type II toxin-antitoxin system VapC family toxin [Gemmataceae bacterium]
MRLIVDTDVLTLIKRKSQPAYGALRARLEEHPEADLWVTIISFQEEVKGWMSFLNKARTPDEILHGYSVLQRVLQDYCRARVLPFDQAAQDRFTELQAQRLRVGTMDLRMACIAMTTGAILLSRNLRDFRRVPGLVVEDWTR